MHTGVATPYPIVEAQGTCTSTPGNGGDIVLALRCEDGAAGIELRAMFRGEDITVLMRRFTDRSDPSDELAFQELTVIDVPPDAAVIAGP